MLDISLSYPSDFKTSFIRLFTLYKQYHHGIFVRYFSIFDKINGKNAKCAYFFISLDENTHNIEKRLPSPPSSSLDICFKMWRIKKLLFGGGDHFCSCAKAEVIFLQLKYKFAVFVNIVNKEKTIINSGHWPPPLILNHFCTTSKVKEQSSSPCLGCKEIKTAYAVRKKER